MARLALSDGRVDDRATAVLRRIKLTANKRATDLNGVVVQAGYYAKKLNQTVYGYLGNSMMHVVWRASTKPSEYLDPINNQGDKVFSVTPDLVVSWHDVIRNDSTKEQKMAREARVSETHRCGYRVNYGNGQVSNTFTHLKGARFERDQANRTGGDWAYIEFRDCDTGEWFKLRGERAGARESPRVGGARAVFVEPAHEMREKDMHPTSTWQGIEYNEKAYYNVRNALVHIVLYGIQGGIATDRAISRPEADEIIARGERTLADFERQRAPRGEAQRWLARHTAELHRLVEEARAVRDGWAGPKLMGEPDTSDTREAPRTVAAIHGYDIEAVFHNARSARKYESETRSLLQLPLISQHAIRDGYVLVYGPIERDGYRELEGRLYSRFGNAVRVRLVERMYAGGSEAREASHVVAAVSNDKKQAAFRRLDHFFGSPSAQQRGFPSEDAAAHSAATLLAGQMKLKYGTAIEIVREWYRRSSVIEEGRIVADFNTLDDLIAHAARELGATHVSYPEPGTMQGIRIYFPRKDGQYEAASVWQKQGYWHAQGPGNREIIRHLPRGAQRLAASPNVPEKGDEGERQERHSWRPSEAREAHKPAHDPNPLSGPRKDARDAAIQQAIERTIESGAAHAVWMNKRGEFQVGPSFSGPWRDIIAVSHAPHGHVSYKRYGVEEAPSSVREARGGAPRRAPSGDEAAGRQYAQDQLASDHFRDWVWSQLVEADEMRKKDPSSVLPLETEADYKRVARAMLQQLEWDASRDGFDGSNPSREWVQGFRDELRSPNTAAWLADDVLRPMREG